MLINYMLNGFIFYYILLFINYIICLSYYMPVFFDLQYKLQICIGLHTHDGTEGPTLLITNFRL